MDKVEKLELKLSVTDSEHLWLNGRQFVSLLRVGQMKEGWVSPTVVRCKDCAYWGRTLSEDELRRARVNPWADLVCAVHESDGFYCNDFCSKGKLRGAERGEE